MQCNNSLLYYTVASTGTRVINIPWQNASSINILPSSPSGYIVSPPLPSKIQLSDSGSLISSGELSSSDSGTFNITSVDFTGVHMIRLGVSGELHTTIVTKTV